MRRIWRRAVAWMLAAAVILGGGIIGARIAKAADNQIVTDYNTSIGTGTPMLFGGVGTPGRTDDKAWQAVQGTMGIKIVKVYIDLGKLFPKNADEMDSGAYEEYAHVASGLLTRVKGAGMTAMLEFQNLPAWLDDGNGMYHSKTDYEKMIKKFLGDAKADFEGCISHVEIVPPASLGESDFKDYYFTTAEAVRAELPNTIIGGMGYTLKSSKDTLSPNVKAVLAQSAAEDPSLLQFVSVRGYGVDSVGSTEDYFGEFKEGRKAIRKALDNRDLPLYMTGWSTSASDAKTADSKITGADGIKYQASALFKAMRDGWDMVMFDGTVSSKDQPGSYSYTIDGSGNVTMNPFTKVYDLLANRLGLNTGDFKVVSTDMGSDWPVDDSIAMVNKKEEPVMLLMNFDKAKSGIRLEMKNVPYQDGKVELEGYVASADQDSTKKYLSLTADVTNGILTAKIPTVPANCAMGIIVKGKEKKVLPAQSIYEFESQDNQFGGNTEIAWYTDASFNRIVKGFDGASNFVTLKDVAADGTGTYMAHLYAASPNDHVKVSVNGKAPIDVDCSSVSIKTPASFKVNLEAGHENTLKFYTQSGELRPDRLVLEAKDVQLSIGIQNLSELEKDGQQYILPLAKKDFKVDARIFPEAAAAGKTLVYESSDPSVVAVSADGTLTPNKTGTTAITVKIQGTDIHNSFDIVVKNAVASVSVTPANLTLRQGGTAVLTAQITPSDAENQNVQWESSAPDVVEITEQNQKTASIRAVAESGTASITAKTEDGGKTAVCTVTVVKPVPGGDVTVDYGNTVSTGDPKIFGVTHYPNVNKNDSDIGDHSSVWPMLTNDAGVKFMRADARLQEILPIWTKTPDTNWEKPTGQNADQPNYVKSDYYYVTGPDGVKRKFSVDGYKEDMEYYQKHHTYLNGMSNPDNWNTGRLLSWVDAAKAQGYQVMVMTFQIPEWLSSGEVVSSDPSTKKVCNGAPKDWAIYRDIVKKVYKLLRDKIDYYEFLNEPHWYIPTNGDQRDPQGKPYSGSNIVNDIAADQFYQGIDAIYEAEEEITGVPGAVPKVKLGGGADDSWGGDWGVLGTLFSPKYQKWFDRVNFVSIHKYGERPANPDDSNNGANSRNFKFWLRQKLGRDVPIFLNEYNVNTGQPHDETYGYKSVGWHGKNLIDLMTDGYAGAGYYTCYPADVPMDDYEASSGWIERGKGMYTWNNGAPYLANFTKTWGLMSVKLGLGNGPFKVKSTQIEGQMSQAVGAVNAEGNATAFLNNYSGQAYDNIKVKMKNVPYAEGTQVTASIYMLTSESDPHAAPATCTATVDGNGNVTVEVPEVASWGVAGIVLSGTQKPELDSTYEFESYQNTFHGAAKIEKSAKASNGRWVTGAAGEENAVSVPVQKAEDGSVMLDIHYMADKDSTLTYEINGNKKSIKLPAASDMQTVQIQENLKAGVNDITFYAADKGVTLDKAVVKNLDKKSLQQLVNQEFTKDGYTDKSWAVYEKAKEEAEAVLANSQATGEEVETAYKNLSDAISQLVLMVDLPSLITSAGEKQAADYTTESWVDFSWALQCAKAAAGSQDTAQEEQIKAYQDLDAAMKGLTEVKTDPDANVVQGLMPTSNVEIVRPEKATDGDTNASDSGDDFTQLEAGAETGGSDNGYANWQDVYLQYDLGAEYLINKVDVYRTFYEGGGPIKWKECKVEVSDDPQFMSSGSAPAAADASQPPASGTAASASDASQPPVSGTTVLAYNETLQTEAEQSTPQSIEPSTPVKARYLRVSGRGHQGSWGGYSNKVNFSEIQVFGSYVPDRSCLEGLIGNAEGLDEAAYTPTSWKTLTEKLDAAKKIGDSATLEQMNLAAQDLNTAIRSMKEKADSTKLKQTITNLNDLIQSADWEKLSPSDQETYMNLKDKAEKMANSGEASQAEMDKMADEIANAAETLTASYDKAEAKEALELKIKEAEKMDLTGYSKESVGAFQNVLAEVKEILASEKAGAQEYRNAYSSLTDAIGGLVKESAGQDTPDGNKPDSGNPDAGKPDAGKPDAGKPDAGKPDTGKPDAGKPDTGKPDAGKPDTGKPDTGKPDTGKPDTGKPDASKVNGNQTKDKSISTGDTAAVLSVCAAMILSVLIAGIALFRLKKRK